MKNIQVIDGAMNTTFSIFQATDVEFKAALRNIWERPIRKQDAHGIHGTLL